MHGRWCMGASDSKPSRQLVSEPCVNWRRGSRPGHRVDRDRNSRKRNTRTHIFSCGSHAVHTIPHGNHMWNIWGTSVRGINAPLASQKTYLMIFHQIPNKLKNEKYAIEAKNGSWRKWDRNVNQWRNDEGCFQWCFRRNGEKVAVDLWVWLTIGLRKKIWRLKEKGQKSARVESLAARDLPYVTTLRKKCNHIDSYG